MTKSHSKSAIGQFLTTVCSNERISDSFYRIKFSFSGRAAQAFANAVPGQFAQFDLSACSIPPAEAIPQNLADNACRAVLLRRPFSFCRIAADSGKTFVDVIYNVVGPCTLRMTTLKISDKVNVIGPLGNGFSVPKAKKNALLVAGGAGTPPLMHLADTLVGDFSDIAVTVLAGAKSKEDFPFPTNRFAASEPTLLLATDDGSAGFKGFVSDYLAQWLNKNDLINKDTIIYSCGPEPMLEAVAKIAMHRQIDCRLSLERPMACGIGICQGCAVECKTERGGTVYKMCCTDGPVFDAKDIVFRG